MAALDSDGIDSRPMFHPLSSLPAYDGQAEAAVARKRNEVSYRLSPWGNNLPSAMNLTREQVQRVAEILRRILGVS
jgi:perosamine synthetase